MDLDLKELATTLAVGAFLIFGIEFIALSFFGRAVSSKVATKLQTSQYVIGALTAALCFVFGMIIEDVSNKFVDDEGWLSTYGILESDHKIKTRIFLGDEGESSLVYLAAKYGLLGEYGGPDGEGLENHILRRICDPQDLERLTLREIDINKVSRDDAAKRFYYHAKSVVYRTESYYDELKRIQMRIDFSRALIAVSLFLMIIVAIIGVFKALLLILLKALGWIPKIKNKVPKFHVWLESLRDSIFDKPDIRWGRLFVAYLILGSVITLAIFAYASEEAEFDKRTYGYYLSLKIDTKENPAQAKCKERIL